MNDPISDKEPLFEREFYWGEDSSRSKQAAAALSRILFSRRTAALILAAGALAGGIKIYDIGADTIRRSNESDLRVEVYKQQNGISEDQTLQEAYCQNIAADQVGSSNPVAQQKEYNYQFDFTEAYDECLAETRFMVPMPARDTTTTIKN